MDSTNTRSLRRHSTNLSYAEPSDFDFDGSSPDKEEQTQPYGESGSVQLNQSPGSASERMESNGDIKKRISHACDYCRRKKCKCTGETPCDECRRANNVCQYTINDNSAPHRTYPHRYVATIEQKNEQLDEALRDLHMRVITGQDLTNCPLEYSRLVAWLDRTSTTRRSPSSTFSSSAASSRPRNRTPRYRRTTRSRRASEFGTSGTRGAHSSPDARVEPFNEEDLPPLEASQIEHHHFESTVHHDSPNFNLVDMVNTGHPPSIVADQYEAQPEPSHITTADEGPTNNTYYHTPTPQYHGDYYQQAQPFWSHEFEWPYLRERGEEFPAEYNAHYPTPMSQETGTRSPLNGRPQ